MAGATPYDVITLDLTLPGLDDFETCRRFRGEGVQTSIMMLTRATPWTSASGARHGSGRLPDGTVRLR